MTGGSDPSSASAGLYVHIPYCLSICPYCDFDRQATGFEGIPRYVGALATELTLHQPRSIHSIFFGGGTPSLLDPPLIDRFLRAAAARFDVAPSAEITLEANPTECTVERLTGYRAAGVNRLSIGVQSLDDGELAVLGRRHEAATVDMAVRAARRAGFDNLSLDLMLGLPGSSDESWRLTLGRAIELAPQHLSCYVLTLDDRTPMGRDVAAGRILLPSDDAVADQYALTQSLLKQAGFVQYEISNWAQPARESRHNLTYWRDEPYVGVGAGAAGSINGRRYKNTPSPRRYMQSVRRGAVDLVEDEQPDRAISLCDFIALGLRLREGLDLAELERRYAVDLRDLLGSRLSDLVAARVLETSDERLRVAEPHILVSSEIFAQLTAAVRESLALSSELAIAR